MVELKCRHCRKPYEIKFNITPEPNNANIDFCSIHHRCPVCGTGYVLTIDFSPTNENAKKKPKLKVEMDDKNYIG